MSKTRILVSGANGFVGRALCLELIDQGYDVVVAVRDARQLPDGVNPVLVGEFTIDTDWNDALQNVDVIVHLAARAHRMSEGANDALDDFRNVNVGVTISLARAAAARGVKRMVYVSSIGVNGPETVLGSAFTEQDTPNPQSSYAVSKWEAEQSLLRIEEEAGLEVVIVRPPLVYGPHAPGNFSLLLKALVKKWPMPLASVNNMRSFIFIGNLVDALILCATHAAASSNIYLVSDGEDVSTPNLLRQLGAATDQPVILFFCPPWLLRLAGHLTGKSEQIDRLLSSLQIDNRKIREELAWAPRFSLLQGLRATAESLRTKK